MILQGTIDVTVLPNGDLALCVCIGIHVLDLGLAPPPDMLPLAPAVAARPAGRTLPVDLGALLDRQPDGTADLEVVVGDTAFPVHRALLGARCDYFRQRLQGGFADGAAARLSLPDAEPEAFALLLRFLYTGHVDIPAALARAVAELADRLLLPELCLGAQARVLATPGPETLIDTLLWAESRGPGYSQLRASLAELYLEHHQEINHSWADGLRRLMAESPELMMELVLKLGGRAAQATPRPRLALGG
ncbi:hypothetical protein GPECTOR_36g44 [Gonium pectorale]|uniref:BTB domain-containing protein n=1 Tax=Gonium pectorale TaxID=33097 RepID=A0A150GDA4_GONPE|nr:hypothetical protein GPECTOR_36g44 [Gonium pectorale]|eukprot:KXZ47320.1 hypothetical protein GPECTOR_36g44 [Gonium pectorale]